VNSIANASSKAGTLGTGVVRPKKLKTFSGDVQKWTKKIQELHAKEVGVGNPSEERASS
jgi:hypothetical protein